MPTRSCPAITGRRRTLCPAMVASASSSKSSAPMVTGLPFAKLPAVTVAGSWCFATTCTTMSRSDTIPVSRLSSPQIGSEPTPSSAIFSAAVATDSFSPTHSAPAVIASRYRTGHDQPLISRVHGPYLTPVPYPSPLTRPWTQLGGVDCVTCTPWARSAATAGQWCLHGITSRSRSRLPCCLTVPPSLPAYRWQLMTCGPRPATPRVALGRGPGVLRPQPVDVSAPLALDSCFHAVVWAELGDGRALTELDATLAGRLVPHMRYGGQSPDTFLGPPWPPRRPSPHRRCSVTPSRCSSSEDSRWTR